MKLGKSDWVRPLQGMPDLARSCSNFKVVGTDNGPFKDTRKTFRDGPREAVKRKTLVKKEAYALDDDDDDSFRSAYKVSSQLRNVQQQQHV